MFVGHYGPAFALKRWAPDTPLVGLFLGVQLVDIAWASFVLAGVEHVRIVPGFTASNPLDLYYLPYTHSLALTPVWAVAAGLVTWLALGRKSLRVPIAIAIAVASHWLLDFPMHRADLPLYDNSHKVGLGLWDYRWPALAAEIISLGVGAALYAGGTRTRDLIDGIGLWIFVVALICAQLFNLLGTPPSTPNSVATAALGAYVVFTVIAHLIDRRRERR
jgi:hypothetical protein